MHVQTQGEWEEEMAEKILDFVRNEIYLDLRFLETALAGLVYKKNDSLMTFATDGVYLYYSPQQVMRVFKSNGKFLDRAYLHTILHCIFAHLWLGAGRERSLWGLACDIMVEYTIDTMDKTCTRRILSYLRTEMYQEIQAYEEGISAAVIYRNLKRTARENQDKISALSAEFYTDDHGKWPNEGEEEQNVKAAAAVQEKWNRLARQTEMIRKMRGEENGEKEAFFEAEISAGRSRRNYKDFLRKFCVFREEMRVDMDEFDLNYYTFGLKLYGNLPLIEPLESRIEHRIQEFIVAVDTSYSTNGELIGSFLKETFDILNEKNSFFRHAEIRILQCDDQVRMDTKISGSDQLETWLSDFKPIGGGGTDFRPVFTYVNDRIAEGELKDLSGLLYFTDGKGIYPKKRPEYKTAFLFLNDYDEQAVPPWAMQMKLEPEEFIREY